MKSVMINVVGVRDDEPSLCCAAATITIAIPDDYGLRDAITHIVHHGAAELMRHAAREAIIGLGDWP